MISFILALQTLGKFGNAVQRMLQEYREVVFFGTISARHRLHVPSCIGLLIIARNKWNLKSLQIWRDSNDKFLRKNYYVRLALRRSVFDSSLHVNCIPDSLKLLWWLSRLAVIKL